MNIEKKQNDVQEKRFLTLDELLIEYKTRPKTKFLWSGIKEKSFGLVFGPAKSGKSIFCENLGMTLAIGRESFFGYPLSGEPRKVLFVGLEEFWEERAARNLQRLENLDDKEKKLVGSNFMFQPLDFSRKIVSTKEWEELTKVIVDSEAEIVFIDSITRMNHGKLENSDTAEVIMQKLREVCYILGITLICVHHSPKIGDQTLEMDSMKGSVVFAQESDFAIGVRRTTRKWRYVKNVFFRYAPDDDDVVKVFKINSETWLEHLEDIEEEEILNRSDRRRDDDKRNYIVSYFDNNPNQTFQTKNLVETLKINLSLEERQIKSYLSELVKSNKVVSPKNGYYQSINYEYRKESDGRI